MISSRADRRARPVRALAVTFLLTLAWPAVPAMAEGAPKPLIPSLGAPKPLLSAPGNAGTDAPAPDDAAAPRSTSGSRPSPAKSGITVNRLDSVSAETVGTIGGADNALPADMWRDTPRATIRRMLSLVGETPSTAGIRDLLLRVLLSPAAVPLPSAPSDQGTIVKARIDALERLGAWDEYVRLIDIAPTTGPDGTGTVLPPALRARMKTDAGFLTGDIDTSCTIARDAMLSLPDDRYWQKAGTFCQALAGAWENVEFNLRLMQELGEEDTRFVELMRAVSGTASDLPAMPEAAQLRPIDIAMMRSAGVAPAMSDPDSVPAALIPVLIKFETLPFETRLQLAERGEKLGVVTRADLVALYGMVEIDPAQMDSALTVAATDPSANGRALLYRATESQTVPLAEAQAIQQALQLARRNGRYPQAARLYAPLIDGIPTTSPFSWFAADAAAAYIAAGRVEAAQPWLGLASREARLGPEQATAWREAVIMSRLASGEAAALDKNFLTDWWRGIRNSMPADAPSRAALLFGLLEATGAETPGTVWRGLVDRARPRPTLTPPAALSLARREAAREARLGEGALLTGLALSGAELTEFDPAYLSDSVRGLWQLGLARDANRLALDVYLAFAPAIPAPAPSE